MRKFSWLVLVPVLLVGWLNAHAAVILSGDVGAGTGLLTFTTDYTFTASSSGDTQILVFDDWGGASDLTQTIAFGSGGIGVEVNGLNQGLTTLGLADNLTMTINDVGPTDSYLVWTTPFSILAGDIVEVLSGTFNLNPTSNWNTNVAGSFNGDMYFIDRVGNKITGNGASVPEPSIIALFGLGLLGLGFARRRKA